MVLLTRSNDKRVECRIVSLIWEDLPHRNASTRTSKNFTKKLKTCVIAGGGHGKHNVSEALLSVFIKLFEMLVNNVLIASRVFDSSKNRGGSEHTKSVVILFRFQIFGLKFGHYTVNMGYL